MRVKKHDIIKASVMTGLVEGVSNCGRPRISWIDNVDCQVRIKSATQYTRQLRALIDTNPSALCQPSQTVT